MTVSLEPKTAAIFGDQDIGTHLYSPFLVVKQVGRISLGGQRFKMSRT